jgi:CRISPR-associated protein Cmr4
MFEAKKLLFYYCVSPVHMGAGSAIGAIDNPIQREVHTEHPMLAGSGLKGAARHHFRRAWGDNGAIARLFGPDTNASDHAGAIAFTDAQLVAFPVRSLKNAFVYATSPTALARLKRLAVLAGVDTDWDVPEVAEGHCFMAEKDAAGNDRLILEAFEFAVQGGTVRDIAAWLAGHALPDADEYRFFRDKLGKDLVVLSDAEFGHFVRHATVVEPHVRIDDASGTASDGGLFYTENLPPESILAGLLLGTVERITAKRARDGEKPEFEADGAIAQVLDGIGGKPGLNRQLLQIGGDATTGRGLVVVNAAGDSPEKS